MTRSAGARLGLAFASALAAALAGAGGASSQAAPEPGVVLAPPPTGQLYHAAYPGFGGNEDAVTPQRIDRFQRLAGEPIAWAYFSNNWFDGRIRFPANDVRAAEVAGTVPFIRIMPRSDWSALEPDERFSMQSIIEGRWDDPDGDPATPDGLDGWCAAAAAHAGPLLVELGAEVNNKVHVWNGRWNGAGETTGYGDPTLADGPERYRDAYRHVIDTCRAHGAEGITWFIHYELGGWPAQSWNSDYANYYPGDDYIDWIGFSDYGAVSQGARWHGFRSALDREYGALDALATPGDKPLAALEWAVREDPRRPGRKAAWIRKAVADVTAGRWPRLRALAYWSERWRTDGSVTDLRIGSSSRSRRAYADAVGGAPFTPEPVFGPR